jgi:phospholipase D
LNPYQRKLEIRPEKALMPKEILFREAHRFRAEIAGLPARFAEAIPKGLIMFKVAIALSLGLSYLAPSSVLAQNAIHGPAPASVSVCFVPAEKCVGHIVDAINAAQTNIHVQAYEFSAKGIIDALIAAHARGVDVDVILDYRQYGVSGKGAEEVRKAGIPVWIDHPTDVAHNKLIIIDNKLVIGGSYNYTKQAEERNTENVTFIESPEVAGWYVANWNSRQAVSEPLQD